MTMLKDRGGNFGMMTALVAPLLLAVGGVSIDMANMLMTKNQLQDATDAAALAAASALVSDEKPDIETAKTIARKFLKTQMAGTSSADVPGEGATMAAANTTPASTTPNWDDVNTSEVVITEVPNGAKGKSFKVSVVNKHLLQFNAMTRLLGKNSIELQTSSTAESATESKNAISMYLVLDRSGSMAWKTDTIDKTRTKCINWTASNWGNSYVKETSPCYVDKITTLKSAVEKLFTPLAKVDPDNEYLRVGTVAYNNRQDKPSNLTWGTKDASDYVEALSATGGTDSSSAFDAAVDELLLDSENEAHLAKNGQTPEKYIVFMTDGENTSYNGRTSARDQEKADSVTKAACTTAKNSGIAVFTVAFMAPQRGKDLLKACATSLDHYKEADDAAALVSEFEKIGQKAAAMTARLTK
ncbi:TadE/TadG family protein [Sinorhizobium numidicum]|uniref:TadE/TadG family protein n=1 Tax=Sinorhizobium numidicum TaxID=680248 RepID=A0ABY8CYG4_9HYPH|nr:TadE/TadG family type IV pilus assembly protein [Sinorhizobium numidicum]WEX77031.1 TadE/TadG family protein [Sinorhizobium numidicum]WEX83690.1 TadE/TadG family protein [Sinorhizobium numidicum]